MYVDIPDHPVIRMMEAYGTPYPEEDEEPICPICGEECDTMYTALDGEVLGCDCCVRSKEPDIRFYPRRMEREGRW